MKTLLLTLALSLAGGAETLGTLSQISADRVTFLEGLETHTYQVPADLARRLAQRGLGSRWEYHADGYQLPAAIDRGNDQSIQMAMQTLDHFVSAINHQQWPAALNIMSTRPAHSIATFFAQHTLSPHYSDWLVLELRPDRIVFDTQPTRFSNEFTLIQQNFRWLIESFR
ncbi:MAG: hypothetical protein KF760_23380 [Candidatus Eremiobacteraeota bacterium]|nr:hypothetical protein [Candidatus Eremiobacteraeota bacterium]MCW5866167.1 hypothetical protein [Candidatus Eremiobacteraeota bacterium]